LAKELSLSDEQKSKVTELSLQSIQKKETLMKDASLSEDQKREAFHANRKAEKEQLDAILTADQKAKLAEKKAAMKAEHKDHKGHEGKAQRTPEERAAFRTDRMAKDLTLTEDQKVKVADINLRAVKEEDAIRKDANLTDDQRKASFKGSRNTYKADLKTVLTAEQLKKAEEGKKQHKGKMEGRTCNKPQQPVAPKK